MANLLQVRHFDSIGESLDKIAEHQNEADESNYEYKPDDQEESETSTLSSSPPPSAVVSSPSKIGNCSDQENGGHYVFEASNAIECKYAFYCAEVRAFYGKFGQALFPRV